MERSLLGRRHALPLAVRAVLTLVNANITGRIPKAIGNLSDLVHLNLYNNNIVGAFPTVLYHCRSLQYLNLSNNYIGGELPGDIGHGLASNLSTLDLSANDFNGIIPASLSRLENLWSLTHRRHTGRAG
nr:unnamed protein product [Digitaria exilis]